ncbi:dioxygenase family protein [Streptomyces sp. NPDC002143]
MSSHSETRGDARFTFTEEASEDLVVAAFGDAPDPRLREIMTSLVRHLHAFVKEVGLDQREWAEGIRFLTATGQKCDPTRQEFILLSDVLGVSMLVDAITNATEPRATDSTVLGPFHMVDSPARELGSWIGEVGAGEQALIRGRVLSADGTPLPGALVDVWQADEQGFYDVQVPDRVSEGHLRGLFTTAADGAFWFRTVVPAPYPIPTDGPVGDLLEATRRHPYRPAHVHFIAGAEGHRPVTTHIFVEGSPHLDSDAVFGVKESLVKPFVLVDDPQLAQAHGLDGPFRLCEFDLVLEQADSQ